MSMENVRKFLEMVKTDEKLARKVVELKERIKADVKLGEEKEILAEKVVPLARDCNLEFTVDDFIAFANSEVKNLSKEDLLAISGGKISHIPALGLLFAAGLAFVPSAKGNIPNLPLFEHVTEAATTAEEVENELVEYIKENLKNLDLSNPDKVNSAIYVHLWFHHDIISQSDKENTNVLHCTKDGKTFDIKVDAIIEKAKTLKTAEEVENELVEYIKEFLKNLDLSKPGDVDTLNTFAEGNVYAWLTDKGIEVKHDAKGAKVFHCTKDGETFDIKVDAIIKKVRLRFKYKPLDHSKDSWEKIVETLLDALNVADFDLNRYPPQDQQAIKNDLQWFAGYIKGSLGKCYVRGWRPFDTYGSGNPTDKITAQLNVLKAFVEDGYECGANTKQYNIALGHVLRSS